MRIISGSHKGRSVFPDKNFSARPTTDFAKESLFNVLNNYVSIEDAIVLDLFAGTGSISYEFSSRGAGEVITVEQNYKHYIFIKKTAEQLGLKAIKVYKNDAFAACKKLKGRKFNIIFADPPYTLSNISDIPAAIFDNHLLALDGIAVIEHPRTLDFRSHPFFFEQRQYGSVNFSLFHCCS
ncbi:methyltransferase [Bacteroidia bacterium]|nr:methyltransferase [Bacteroidia bacterium]